MLNFIINLLPWLLLAGAAVALGLLVDWLVCTRSELRKIRLLLEEMSRCEPR